MMEELNAKYPALAEISFTDEQMEAVVGGLKKIGESKGENEITVDDFKNVLKEANVEISDKVNAEMDKMFGDIKSGKIPESELEEIAGGLSKEAKKNLKRAGITLGGIAAFIGGCLVAKKTGLIDKGLNALRSKP